MVDESDELLAARFAERRDGAAMEVLFRRHLPRIHGLASRYMHLREDAEEATSETFLRAFRALRARQFRGEASVGTWLAKITVNVCLERIRQPRLPTLSFDEIEDVVGAGARQDDRADIAGALELLPDAQRLAITLCDLEGYSAQEASAILGRSLTATKSLHYRARRELKEILDRNRQE